MAFAFSQVEVDNLPVERRMIEDRRNNPVAGRDTKFRLLQQNMLAYTFPFVPGFGPSAVNTMSFAQVVDRPLENADSEGIHLYGADFAVSSNAKAKVAGDLFEKVEAAIHWNCAAAWNRMMLSQSWVTAVRYRRPQVAPDPSEQVAVLSLPRNFDWVELLGGAHAQDVASLRSTLASSGLSLPTSTPDLVIVRLPSVVAQDAKWTTDLRDLGWGAQEVLDHAYQDVLGRLNAADILMAIALKKSLRSDRLYQPLYEANNMQIILEGRLGAPEVDFEVHTLSSAGTGAAVTYRAASLAGVISSAANLHRAVRELYEPASASELIKRFLLFLENRLG